MKLNSQGKLPIVLIMLFAAFFIFSSILRTYFAFEMPQSPIQDSGIIFLVQANYGKLVYVTRAGQILLYVSDAAAVVSLALALIVLLVRAGSNA